MPLKNSEFTFTNISFALGDDGPYTMPKSAAQWNVIEIDVDRTVAGGLNSLTTATVITLSMQYQLSHGSWVTATEETLAGGQIPLSARQGGGILKTQTIGFFPPSDTTFPPNTAWQLLVNVAGPSAVVASGTVSWE